MVSSKVEPKLEDKIEEFDQWVKKSMYSEVDGLLDGSMDDLSNGRAAFYKYTSEENTPEHI